MSAPDTERQDAQEPVRWANSVRVLRLRPADTVVLTVDRPLSLSALDNIQEQAKKLFPDNEFVVLLDGVELSVVRPEAAS